MNRLLCILSLCCTTILLSQSPKHELRGVWISSAGGDWPTSTNPAEQRRSLIEIFDRLQKAKFNAVFFQVRPRGNTFYPSAVEPWATQLTGILGNDPGYDPLQFAITEARKRGLELHAWFNVSKVWGSEKLPVNSRHVTRAHRDWVVRFENEWWMDMGIPEARTYTVDLVKELVRNYDIDGIHFDYIRYPSQTFDDWRSFTEWGDGMEQADWRRNNITEFVRDVYAFIQSEKPWVKVGSAPLGIYEPINGAQSSFNGFSGVYQDSRRWLREKIHDYLAPQVYWTIGEQKSPNDPDFSALSADWIREQYGRHVYVGLGAYRPAIREELTEQVLVTRVQRASGHAFFRYENIIPDLSRLTELYSSPAFVPPMPWKDSIPPNMPKEIIVRTEGSRTMIRWRAPDSAADNEQPHQFVIYRSPEKEIDTQRADRILAILPGTEFSFVDEDQGGKEWFYMVTAVDRSGNESRSVKSAPAETKTILSRYEQPGTTVSLSQNSPNPANGRTYISVNLPTRLLMTLSLQHRSADRETVIVHEWRDPGIHVIAVDTGNLPAGTIEYRLKAGDAFLSKTMEKQ